jgi:hypothetical protein
MSRTNILTLLVCVSVIGGGCKGPSATSESALAATTTQLARTAGTPATGNGRSACELITDEEASDIVGSPVLPRERSRGHSSSSCYFAPAPGQSQEFQLRVHWSGGREVWEANEKATAFGARLMGTDRSEATASVTRFEKGRLGDRSSYNPILGGYVLRGDVLLEFNNLITLSDARSKWEKLAKTALSRL